MGPYHLEVKGEKCDPSYNQWVQLWKLLSCSDSAHVDSIDISLNDLIKTTKWYLEDDIMIGILMVANSKQHLSCRLLRPHGDPSADRTLGDSSSISRHQAVIQHCATNAAPSFLRGQNVVVDVAELAERERKRAKANELQRVLLQQSIVRYFLFQFSVRQPTSYGEELTKSPHRLTDRVVLHRIFTDTVSSKEFDVEFTKLLDEKIVSLTSPVEDPDIDQETKLFKCRGTAAFKCHNEMGPYHLEVKGEKCDPSYNQWVQLWKLLSCSDSAHVDSIDISLNDLIKTTKWYLEDDIMIGILMVANSKQIHGI
ncbi:hypothetical protein DAPPUDRAFT_269368 [Daphnia pulex]|uniref:CCDC66 domain-containing protein n=1 Tax=Daphnia pulex TaxID=6669 RepID=E9HZ82_DAPPU|nr:hypothetical protein DAPPUDRAFT_269368 [Daphnia pulex]|eukprot:EFX62948.1 hypothetical protein DAPPUDRAFT_269368 [Daphnia pulex]